MTSINYYTGLNTWQSIDSSKDLIIKKGGMKGHNVKGSTNDALALIQESLYDYGLITNSNNRKKKRVLPQCRIVNSRKSSVEVRKDRVFVELGLKWRDEIYKERLPLVKYEEDGLIVFLTSNKLEDVKGIKLYQVSAIKIKEDSQSLKSLPLMYVASGSANKKKIRRMGETAAEAINAVLDKQKDLVLEAMGMKDTKELEA